jgi:hypothetical protein
MPPTDSPHTVVAELHPQIVEDVKTGLAQRSAVRAATGPESISVVGAALVNPLTLSVIETTVRGLLDLAAQTFGPSIVSGTLAFKDTIRAVIGQAVLQMMDTTIHGLMDAHVANPGS